MPPLSDIAKLLVAPGKGILAADESAPTIAKRFQSIHLTSTEETRRSYRELLFTTPGLEQSISGIILYDETLRQRAADGTPFPDVLRQQGILPGIKVDRGTQALALFPGEKITEGLDGLRERFAEYSRLGAQFSKWRAVITIGPNLPTPFCLEAHAHALARFAALSQEAGLVPIVEPEVLMDGSHTLERCEAVTADALATVFAALAAHRVVFEAMLLKPNMVVAGKECPQPAAPQDVAAATVRCLKRFVPAAVPGIVFLSGGLDEVTATQNLNAMNQLGGAPWELSFSFGRALQAPALRAWAGLPANAAAAQRALQHRAHCNQLARAGHYLPTMDPKPAPPRPSPQATA